MKTLFVGDNNQSLSILAKQHDPNAFLIDRTNWKNLLDQKTNDNITIYTSLSDLPKIENNTHALWNIIEISDKIFYCPPAQWSDDVGSWSWTSQKILTEFYLALAKNNGHEVVGIDLDPYKQSSYLDLVDKRQHDSKSLWICGCSISHGAGIDISMRYGTLVGKLLNLPTHHLTRSGSSLEWAADQILRSDIRTGDILIWGLTRETRAPIAKNGMIQNMDDSPQYIDFRLDETRYYKALTSVFQVINFCDKIKCNLVLLPLICSEKLQMALWHHKCFQKLPYRTKYVDYAEDNLHPGPKQHQIYADICIDTINKSNTN